MEKKCLKSEAACFDWFLGVSFLDRKPCILHHQQLSPTGSVLGSNLKWMMSQGGVPTFGNWSAAGDTPYTQKFENLRRSKKTAGGVYSNPNEVTETPDQPPPPPLRSPLHPSSHNTPDALNQRQRYERKPETGHPRPAGSPLHRENLPRRHANPLRQHHLDHGGYGGSPRSPYREVAAATSAAAAASPRSRYRSAGMQTPDRKASSSDGRVPMTPGRSRLKQGGRGFEPASDEVTVPPFGDWDDANAASGEKYTGIFNRVRRDKLSPNSSVKQQPPSSSGRQEHEVQQLFIGIMKNADDVYL
uniref:RIN4 pathogenic type III effector avirulence factor Avr cleavage site domain-containing protein n=1 Tax=Oryza punctata TaxID=4537 RepID=A0A0E0K042_ORYPU